MWFFFRSRFSCLYLPSFHRIKQLYKYLFQFSFLHCVRRSSKLSSEFWYVVFSRNPIVRVAIRCTAFVHIVIPDIWWDKFDGNTKEYVVQEYFYWLNYKLFNHSSISYWCCSSEDRLLLLHCCVLYCSINWWHRM